jgi:hypothetical protein
MTRQTLSRIWWENSQNLPMIAGFAVSAKLFLAGEHAVGIVIVVIMMIAGAAILQMTENRMSLKSAPAMMANAAIFSTLAVIALFYFHLVPGKYDIIGGVVIGVVMSVAQAIAEREPIRSAFQHAAAMAVGCGIIMVVLRSIINASVWITILGAVVLSVVVSAIIVVLDYDPTSSAAE